MNLEQETSIPPPQPIRAWSPEQKAKWLICLFERNSGGIERVQIELQRWALDQDEFAKVQAHVLCVVLERDYDLRAVEEFAEMFRVVDKHSKAQAESSARLKTIRPMMVARSRSEVLIPGRQGPPDTSGRYPITQVGQGTSQRGLLRPHANPSRSSQRLNVVPPASTTGGSTRLFKSSDTRVLRQRESTLRFAEEAQSRVEGPYVSGASILLIEGDLYARETLSAQLGAHFMVKSVANGLAAMRQLQHMDFSLVVLDMQAPGKYDLEVLKKLLNNASRVPVVLCTGRNDVMRFNEVRAYAPIRICPKPVDAYALVSVIREMLMAAN